MSQYLVGLGFVLSNKTKEESSYSLRELTMTGNRTQVQCNLHLIWPTFSETVAKMPEC